MAGALGVLLFCLELIGVAKSIFRWRHHSNPPYPPFRKGGNLPEFLLKYPFDKGGFRGIWKPANGRIFGKRYIARDSVSEVVRQKKSRGGERPMTPGRLPEPPLGVNPENPRPRR